MRKFNRRIRIELTEGVRDAVHTMLRRMLHPDVQGMACDEDSVSLASILADVEKKLNRNVSQQARKSHRFSLKYHEASALKEFITLLGDAQSGAWTYASMVELVMCIDRQLA